MTAVSPTASAATTNQPPMVRPSRQDLDRWSSLLASHAVSAYKLDDYQQRRQEQQQTVAETKSRQGGLNWLELMSLAGTIFGATRLFRSGKHEEKTPTATSVQQQHSAMTQMLGFLWRLTPFARNK